MLLGYAHSRLLFTGVLLLSQWSIKSLDLQHTISRRKTIAGLLEILETHDLPSEMESLGKALDYPFPISEIRQLRRCGLQSRYNGLTRLPRKT